MNDDGKLRLPRQRHLVAKNAVLHIARRMIVKIIETDFAPSNDFGMLRQPGQLVQMLVRNFLRLVGMNPDGGVNPLVLLGKGQRGIELFRTWACADCKQCRHSRFASAVEHGVAVFRELWEVDVRVRID